MLGDQSTPKVEEFHPQGSFGLGGRVAKVGLPPNLKLENQQVLRAGQVEGCRRGLIRLENVKVLGNGKIALQSKEKVAGTFRSRGQSPAGTSAAGKISEKLLIGLCGEIVFVDQDVAEAESGQRFGPRGLREFGGERGEGFGWIPTVDAACGRCATMPCCGEVAVRGAIGDSGREIEDRPRLHLLQKLGFFERGAQEADPARLSRSDRDGIERVEKVAEDQAGEKNRSPDPLGDRGMHSLEDGQGTEGGEQAPAKGEQEPQAPAQGICFRSASLQPAARQFLPQAVAN